MPTFGKTTAGATRDGRIPNQVQACRYTCPENSVLTKISAYIALYNAGYYVKAAVYSDLNGSPNSLLAESEPVAVGTALNWYDFLMPSINIPANTPVWLCLLANNAMSIYYDAGDVGQYKARNTAYPTFPNPFGTPQESYAWAQSIYAEYTLGVPSTLGITISPDTPQAIVFGQSVAFVASPAGGSPPYTIEWYVNDVLTATGTSFTFTPTAQGTYNVYAKVIDIFGTSIQSLIVLVTVAPPITHSLVINSEPVQGVPFTIEEV